MIVKGLLCSAAASALLSTYPLFVKAVVDAVQARDQRALGLLSVVIVGLFAVKYTFTRGQSYYLSKAAARLTSDLRIKLFDKLLKLPIRYFSDKRAGQIQSVLTNDVNVYQNAVAAIRDAIDGPIKAVGGIVFIFVINWQLALAAMAVLPLMVVAIQQNSKKMRRAQAEVQSDLSNLTAMMQETLEGHRVVKAFAAEAPMSARFRSLVEASFASQVRAISRVASLRPMVELIGAIGLALVIYICGILVSQQKLNVGELSGFIIALDVINQGFKNIASLFNTQSQVQAASDRIYSEILDQHSPSDDASHHATIEQLKGRIEFEDVWFTYPDGTQALRAVSFVIEPGDSLALVGASGAGKSTIADLLLQFYEPTKGRVLLDGVDIRDLSAKWLRGQIGVVPQNTFLFAGSVSDNLRLSDPDATQAAIDEALRIAHADGFVEQMPHGVLSEIGERGVRLSGGEAQRIAIARAVVRSPKVLLLDEATSNLDPLSERAVQEAIEDVMKSRTTLFIAHRLSTAARAHRILVLRQGEVLEIGTHQELIQKNGAYAGMYHAFSSGALDDSLA